MRRLIVLPAAVLAGCLGLPRPAANLAYHDFGPPQTPPAAAALAVRQVEVVAPSWLDNPALQYRLGYADVTRRESYAASRWIAPPGALLEAALRRAIVSGDTPRAAGGCKLRIDLDELAQVFQAPQRSSGVIEVRAALLAPRGDAPLARQRFSVDRPAASADARGGVEAISAAAQALAANLRDWLAALDRERPAGLNIAQTCRGA